MNVSSDDVEIFENNYEKIKSDEEITDLELEIKMEKLDEKGNIKTELFEESVSGDLQIIGEKRKNEEISNLENKKSKEEFVVFEEQDHKQEPQEIEETNIDDSNNKVQ